MSPRKATTTKKTTESKFDKFRQRAIETAGDKLDGPVTNEPFILGEEYEIDPPIEIKKPSFKARFAIEGAANAGEISRTLALLMGSANLNRLLDVLSEYEEETGEAGDMILAGVFIEVVEHFYGKGAALTGFLQQ